MNENQLQRLLGYADEMLTVLNAIADSLERIAASVRRPDEERDEQDKP